MKLPFAVLVFLLLVNLVKSQKIEKVYLRSHSWSIADNEELIKWLNHILDYSKRMKK